MEHCDLTSGHVGILLLYRAIEFADPSQVPSAQSMLKWCFSESIRKGCKMGMLSSPLLLASFHWVSPPAWARS